VGDIVGENYGIIEKWIGIEGIELAQIGLCTEYMP
jgi:hypothetical protein